jgi:hypothetical protein
LVYSGSSIGSVEYGSLSQESVITASLTLPQFTTELAGHLSVDASLTLPIFTVNAVSGALGSLDLPIFTTSFAGHLSVEASLTFPIFTVNAEAGSLVSLDLPIFTTSFAGHLGVDGSVTLPQLSLSAFSSPGIASLTLPQFTLNGVSDNVTSADITLPQFTTSFAGHLEVTASLTLPQFTTDFAGHLGVDGSVTLPQLSLSAFISPGIASLTFPVLTLDGAASGLYEGSVTLPLLSLSAFISPGIVDITLPVITLSATAGRPRASLTFPMFTVVARAYKGTPPETVVMNTKISAISEYKDYAFNSYTRFNGADLVANQNGIYEEDKSGVDDSVYKIKAHVRSGQVDIHNGTIHRLRNGFLSHETDGDVQVTSVAESAKTRKYYLTLQDIQGIKERRVKFERGIKDRHFDFKIENVDGSSLEIDKFTVLTEPVISKRR